MYGEKDRPTQEADTTLIKAAARSILYIAVCVTAGIVFATCGVSGDTIKECKDACSPEDMQSVSKWSCQCSYSSSSDDWVIPRSTTTQQGNRRTR